MNLYQLQKKLKLKKKDFILLLEAYRRKNLLEADDLFLGLGCPYEYKGSNLFTPSYKEYKRSLNWYKLTDLGKEKLSELEELFPVPSNSKEADELNLQLFNV